MKIDYVYTFTFLISLVLPILIVIYILIPRFLRREKYILFTVTFLINLLLFSQLQALYYEPVLDILFPDYYFISYTSGTRLITIFSIFLIVTTLIKLSEDWFYFNRSENLKLKKKNQQIQSQLTSLRSQINPHFLFNSLNVIYAMALEEKKETKDAIVQLSDILRYIIYDTDTKRVTLKDEITLLQNYIAFQKFRVHGFEKVQIHTDIANDAYTLYPMLLLPLVENSYKHGHRNNPEDTFITIHILQKGPAFQFKIENSYTNDISETDNEYSGIGLYNVQKNLKIVYPDTHELTTSKTETTFAVTLKIETTHDNYMYGH
ncbi:sensor histidine kinase [Ascidiimonas aurantiaca]|uniref:sensor histidine kinase n=1 Tax=Ascidiimonas aurantiaca TaxID=1685432 RepID=UPI0030EECF7A